METMLVAVDFAGCGYEVVDQAAAMAERLQQRVVVLHVVQLPPGVQANDTLLECDACDVDTVATAEGSLVADARQELSTMSQAFLGRSVPTRIEVRHGDPRAAILAAATAHSADLIALGTHGRKGLERVMWGSVAESVIREAPCPVVTFRMHGSERGPTVTQRQVMAEGDG